MHYATGNRREFEFSSDREKESITASKSGMVGFLGNGELEPLIGFWVESEELAVLGEDVVLAVEEEKGFLLGSGDGGGEGGGGGDGVPELADGGGAYNEGNWEEREDEFG